MTPFLVSRDRATASEHALLLIRRVPSAIADVAATLPSAFHSLAEHERLLFPSTASVAPVPVDAACKCLPDHSRCLLRLRYGSKGKLSDFFEGEIRLDGISEDETELTLIGRFIVPGELRTERFGENEFRQVAEENVLKLFESALSRLGSE